MLVERLPVEKRDVHFTSAYGRVQEKLGGKSILAVLTDGDVTIMQPFMVRDNDIASPYGYGGPISINMTPEEAIAAFHTELRQWCAGHGIVAEYCRFHPLFATDQWKLSLPEPGEGFSAKAVAIIQLKELSERSVARRVRRALQKTHHLEVVECGAEGRKIFSLHYAESMKLKKASPRWHFSDEYLNAHYDELSARLFLLRAARASRMLMVVGGYGTAYAHLLGSNGIDLHGGLDERLYFDVALTLRDDGYERFHLGGGMTDDPKDSLLMFKQGFVSNVTFACFGYHRIFDEHGYRALCERKIAAEIAAHGRASVANFFPAYRREFA